MGTLKLSEVVATWDELHVKDTGVLLYSDLERAIEAAGIEIINDLKEQPMK